MSEGTNNENIGADGREAGESEPTAQDTSPNAPTGMQAVINHITRDKVDAGLWISRITTIIFTISFVLPLFGVSQHTSGQRVLIAGALTSALRLHQRAPQLQLSRELLATLLNEDSAHYLFYSAIMLFTTQPVSIILMPVFLFALLHVTKYTKTLLNLLGPTSMPIVRNLLLKVDSNQRQILKLIATVEITLMPTGLLLIFSGFATLILPFLYYRFLCMRYSSVRNPYNRTVFYELRLLAEHLSRDQRCPAFLSNITHKVIAFVCRMAPVAAQP